MAESDYAHPVKGLNSLSTEYAAAVVVLGAMAILIIIRRGFRGVSLGGASVRVG
jgi:hypothetical protein